ncbi:hypothetical protein [Phytoactinopolyspora limicola]|uniref:hypothetical protein n=1 Tax=Phytoactinopolyspora limicola TaxID=2715536 RepID=UPI00140D62FA|nr:hypothetical protein [Phytoactinopolyspora limicola]
MTADPIPEPFDDERWTALIDDERGVVHRREIPASYAGHARREVRAKRWQRVGRDVFVVHNGPLTPEQRALAALKIAPAGSALSGLTAASIDGLSGFDPAEVHVTLPCGYRRLKLAGVVEHFSRFLSSSDIHPLRRPRRTRPARSLLDSASWASSDQHARAILLAGVQQGLVSAQQLSDALPGRGPCARHALIAETLDDAQGGIQSVPEWRFAAIIRTYALPEPSRQLVRQRPDGRSYLDAGWDEYALYAEVDGMGHLEARRWEADIDRANEIVISSGVLLRFTSYAVRHRAEAVASTLIRALMARGWPGP